MENKDELLGLKILVDYVKKQSNWEKQLHKGKFLNLSRLTMANMDFSKVDTFEFNKLIRSV